MITQRNLPVACLYVVKTGRVQALEINEEGAEIPLAEYFPGDYFGEMSLLTGEPSAATTRAMEDTEVFVLFKMHFDEVLRENPTINRHFVNLLSEKLRKVRDQVSEARDKELAFNRFLSQEQEFQYSEVVGQSKKTKAILKLIETEASHDRPVLVRGERGAGKELVARSIHQGSSRKDEPFIPVSCENLAEEAWGSELFGHERGAIPSVTASRLGYLELASKGTLLLKNVDRLPRDSQRMLAEFLDHGEFRHLGGKEVLRADVRVIVTTEKDLEEMTRCGEFYGELSEILKENTIEMVPLRDRKKDITALVDHFITKTAKRNGSRPKTVSPEAMNLLLSYDYPGNVAELENVVERAFILAADGVIEADQIYLGLPHRPVRARYNLLKNRYIWAYFQSNFYPIAIRAFTVVLFAGIFYSLFFGNQDANRNLGNILVLSLWWPSLFLFCFFVARSWCAICPIGATSGFIQRFASFRLSLPEFFKRTEMWIPAFLFVFIFWVERVTDAHSFPRATGFVLLGITLGAIVMSVVFDRKVWCRYICALGNMCGIYAMASVLEIRANADVCINQCKTHECFKGGKVDGCPMFRHALFLEENQSCRVCTYCVKNCPYHAVQINLRPPGQELWNVQKPVAGGAFFSILLATLVFAAVLPDLYGFELSFWRIFPFARGSGIVAFTTLILLTISASLVIFWSGEFVFGEGKQNPAHFARYSFAFIPLALCGHFANQLRYLPGAERLTLQLAKHLQGVPTVFASFRVIWPLQLLLVLAGVFWSLFVVYRNYSRGREGEVSREPRLVIYVLGFIGLYGAALFWLFVALGRTV
ncbi:MAG: cyclic nucleotide-binding domain-containing protein [Proteobacteria bacterium]|nr:cyclic nucleotide-binding domain-containing protein [Pseudomonadota bacterium]NIS71731.1 cyclic nucleotide-binding domain-containing protein [Pseudomonadota bacterium]